MVSQSAPESCSITTNSCLSDPYVLKAVLSSPTSFTHIYTLHFLADLKANLPKEVSRATLLWKPLDGLTQEDESVIDGYLELACSPAVLHGGRNKELGLHFLNALGGSIKVC